MGGATGNGAYIQAILEYAQLVAVCVYNGNVVLFVGEVLCQGTANLAGTKNNDLQVTRSSDESVCTINKRPAECKGHGRGIMHICYGVHTAVFLSLA